MEKQMWLIDQKNLEMCNWAFKYLKRGHGLTLMPHMQSKFDACFIFLSNMDKESRTLLELKMQAAWRQKKYRDNQKRLGKKPCSFILSRGALKELDRLSSSLGLSLNEALERLIHQTYLADKALKKRPKQKLATF